MLHKVKNIYVKFYFLESMDSERNESETDDSDSFSNSHYYYSWSECDHHDPLSVTVNIIAITVNTVILNSV